MPSIFKSRSNKSKPSSTPLKATSSSSSSSTHSNHLINSSQSLPSLHTQSNQLSIYKPAHIDDFGRPILNPTPAFTLASTSTSSHQLSNHHHPSADQAQELQLLYGYTGLFTQIELDIKTTSQLIKLISNQLKSRPLDSPLIFSSHALDLSIDSTHSLIRSCINRHHSHFLRDLQISSPHNLSAFLKWVLARYINPQSQHGLLNWSSYLLWRQAENDSNYPPDSITTQLLNTLTSDIAEILITLLDLFSSVAAYSHLNGITIHKCGAIFGAFIFGLEDDLPFEQTYSNWLRYAHATEHMVLAYLRDQKAKSTTGQIASRLESCIRSYPKVIPSLTSTHPSARLESVARFRRNVRFYNKNLIQNASKWDVKGSKTWQRLLSDHHSSPNLNSSSSNPTHKQNKPIFTKSYKHLLNISSEQELEGLDENDRHEIDLETQRFKSLVEKQWSGFISKGFDDGVIGSSETEKKLEFDLDETEKQQRRQRRETMDWDSFAGSGFAGRETFTAKELLFNTTVSNKVNNWPSEEKDLSKKLNKTHKILPEFPYDIEPIEISPILVDDNFFEAWVDALIASGWTRDELKEVSWALIQYKSKFNNDTSSPNSILSSNCLSNDTRHDEMWVLFEEVVPEDYRMMLMKNGGDKSNAKRSRRISFLKAVITRSHKDHNKKPGLHSQLSTSSSLSVINEYGGQQMTKKITLTPDLPSSSSFSDVSSMISHSNSQHPSERTMGDPNRPTAGSGGGGTGFMAELRARAKRRQQNYNVGGQVSHPNQHQHQHPHPPNQRGEEWVNVRTDADSNPIPLRPHNPTPPSILSSSRSITPIQDQINPTHPIGAHHEQKRRVVPNRKESLVNSFHSDCLSQECLTENDSHRGSNHSSSVTSLDLSVRSGEEQETGIEKKSYGSMTHHKERKPVHGRYEEEEKEDNQLNPSIKSLKENPKPIHEPLKQNHTIEGVDPRLVMIKSNSKISFPSEGISSKPLQRNLNSSQGSSNNSSTSSNPTKLSPAKNLIYPGIGSTNTTSMNPKLNSGQGSPNKPIAKNLSENVSRNLNQLNQFNSSSLPNKPIKPTLESSTPKINSLSPPRSLNPSLPGRQSPNLPNRYLTPKKSNLKDDAKVLNSSGSLVDSNLSFRNEEMKKKMIELKSKLNSNPTLSDPKLKNSLSESIKQDIKPIEVFEKSKVQKVSKIVDMFEKSEPGLSYSSTSSSSTLMKVNKPLTGKEKQVISKVEELMKKQEVVEVKLNGFDNDDELDDEQFGKGSLESIKPSGIPVRQFKLSRVGEE